MAVAGVVSSRSEQHTRFACRAWCPRRTPSRLGSARVFACWAIVSRVAKFNWDPKVPFDQFDVRSIGNARNASENQGYRDQFLASIRDRLGTAAVKGQALDLCQELFLADGARSEEEEAVLQNLRKLLE